ncbi:MAG: hypothetical protein WCF77_00055 [Minisyncoccia bacterium]
MANRAAQDRDHFLFFHFYLAHYVTFPTAPFQKEIFRLTQDESVKNLFITSFRNSSKSTILGLSLPLWSILGAPQKKFVLLLAQTRTQGKLMLKNIKDELEANAMLRSDLWPFEEESDEWSSGALNFPKLAARIMVASVEQGVRGVRQHQFRPDLIICDDVEDLGSTKTQEGREKTWRWITGDVIPAGDRNTRLVVIGNLLHEESLLMRLKKSIEAGTMAGVFKEYPLVNEDGTVAWPGKYAFNRDIAEEKRKTGSEQAFQREFMLKIIAEEDQVIVPEDIHYYDIDTELAEVAADARGTTATGIDLAISQKDAADFTAMVTGQIVYHWKGADGTLFILPNIVNAKMSFQEAILRAKAIEAECHVGWYHHFFVEKVGYQDAYIQELSRHNMNVIPMPPAGDKRSRFAIAATYIKNGTVRFPNEGCEDLIRQMVHFGSEAHDDLLDALVYLILGVIDEGMLNLPTVLWV